MVVASRSVMHSLLKLCFFNEASNPWWVGKYIGEHLFVVPCSKRMHRHERGHVDTTSFTASFTTLSKTSAINNWLYLHLVFVDMEMANDED